MRVVFAGTPPFAAPALEALVEAAEPAKCPRLRCMRLGPVRLKRDGPIQAVHGRFKSPAAHQNDSRKRFHNDGIKVLAGEKNSPFVRAVMIAEATSKVPPEAVPVIPKTTSNPAPIITDDNNRERANLRSIT